MTNKISTEEIETRKKELGQQKEEEKRQFRQQIINLLALGCDVEAALLEFQNDGTRGWEFFPEDKERLKRAAAQIVKTIGRITVPHGNENTDNVISELWVARNIYSSLGMPIEEVDKMMIDYKIKEAATKIR